MTRTFQSRSDWSTFSAASFETAYFSLRVYLVSFDFDKTFAEGRRTAFLGRTREVTFPDRLTKEFSQPLQSSDCEHASNRQAPSGQRR